jgi:hypothetical protein
MKDKVFLDDYVKELFQNSRGEEPVLSLDEVSTSLGKIAPKKAESGWRFYMVVLTGILGLFSFIFWFLSPQNNTEITTLSIPQLTEMGFNVGQNSRPTLVQNDSSKAMHTLTKIRLEDSAIVKESRVPRFEDVPFLVNNFDFEENGMI